jgi:hypothetical protein
MLLEAVRSAGNTQSSCDSLGMEQKVSIANGGRQVKPRTHEFFLVFADPTRFLLLFGSVEWLLCKITIVIRF